MAPAGGALVGVRWGTPVASRDESKNRAGLYLGRDVDGKSAAVGENLLTIAEGRRGRRVESRHRVERAGTARNVHRVGVDEHTKRVSASHGRTMSRGVVGAATGWGTLFRYAMNASRSVISTGSVLSAAAPNPRLSPPVAVKLLCTTV